MSNANSSSSECRATAKRLVVTRRPVSAGQWAMLCDRVGTIPDLVDYTGHRGHRGAERAPTKNWTTAAVGATMLWLWGPQCRGHCHQPTLVAQCYRSMSVHILNRLCDNRRESAAGHNHCSLSFNTNYGGTRSLQSPPLSAIRSIWSRTIAVTNTLEDRTLDNRTHDTKHSLLTQHMHNTTDKHFEHNRRVD